MGELINLKKKLKGAEKYLESGLVVSGLSKEDYTILSMIVMDNDFQGYSLGGFLGKSSNELFENVSGKPIDIAKSLVKESEKTNEGVMQTPMPKLNKIVFYKLKNTTIDIDLATELGLGVVEYKNERMIYSPFYTENPKEAVYEMLRLKIYLQLLNPDDLDESLKDSFMRNEDLIQSMILINMPKHSNQLKRIYQLD